MPNQPTPPLDERRTVAWIGKALRIEGRITSRENLTIDGEVEGTIEHGEHSLTIGTGAAVTADLLFGVRRIGVLHRQCLLMRWRHDHLNHARLNRARQPAINRPINPRHLSTKGKT